MASKPRRSRSRPAPLHRTPTQTTPGSETAKCIGRAGFQQIRTRHFRRHAAEFGPFPCDERGQLDVNVCSIAEHVFRFGAAAVRAAPACACPRDPLWSILIRPTGTERELFRLTESGCLTKCCVEEM